MSDIDELLKSVKAKLKGRGVIRNKSVEAWRNYFFNEYHRWRTTGVSNLGDPHNYPLWFVGKEIRIFRMPKVDEKVVPYVRAGIEDLIHQIGLDFNVTYYGPHPSAVEQVRESIKPDGRIDGDKLSQILVSENWRRPEYGGRPHTDIYITDRFLALGDRNWGQSQFVYGYMILALPRERQESLEFIRNISKHEAGHLLGFPEHHDGDFSDVKGYSPVQDCNMLWQASTRYTCDKCADALVYFWKGIEATTGQRFFRSQ